MAGTALTALPAGERYPDLDGHYAAKDQPAILRFYQRHGLRPWGIQFFR